MLLLYGLHKAYMEEKHKFKCDCEACDPSMKLTCIDFENAAGIKDNIFSYKSNPAYDRNYARSKEVLKETWDDVNENPSPHKYESFYVRRSKRILETIAFHCNFPFPKMED